MNCIYSIFVNKKNINKNINTAELYQKHFEVLNNTKQKYANYLNCDYILFDYHDDMEEFNFVSLYDRINYLKYFYGEILSEKYDKILYLDFDILIKTKKNIFDVYNEDYFYIFWNDYPFKNKTWIKKLNAQKKIYKKNNRIFGTGVMLFDKKNIKKLNFFEQIFKITPSYEMCYNNEVIFSIQTIKNNVNVYKIDAEWNDPNGKYFQHLVYKSKFEQEINNYNEIYKDLF